MTVRITSICARSGGEETEVTFVTESISGEHSSRDSFILSSGQYLTMGLEVGESDTEQYDTVEHASLVWDATKRAIAALGYGACSEKALRIKLISKGYDKQIATEAVESLASKGFLNADSDAERVAEKMAAKLWGKRRIISGLYEKGYSAEAVAFAVNALEDSGIDFVANCRALIEKRYASALEDKDAQRKAFPALMRYGYSASEIKQAFE